MKAVNTGNREFPPEKSGFMRKKRSGSGLRDRANTPGETKKKMDNNAIQSARQISNNIFFVRFLCLYRGRPVRERAAIRSALSGVC